MDILIRKAVPEDALGITEVKTFTWLTTYKGLLPNSVLDERIQTISKRAIKNKRKSIEKNNSFVATVDNKIVGVISYGKSRNEKFPNCGEINAIYVLKEFQGKGIGKKLFFSGIQELINNGFENMILNVLKGNKTINFYEYYGGKNIGSRFEQFGDETIEEYIMYFDNIKEINKINNEIKVINKFNKIQSNFKKGEKISKKIVAIGGGENGRIGSNGEQKPYETLEIDKEIVRLAEKDNPNLLLLAHSQIPFGEEAEERYYNVIKKIFEKLECNVKWLKVSELRESLDKAKNYVEWADIIYEGGGATDYMLEFWKETGFDEVLKEAWESGKVMCGVSAGAICWFNSGFTDSPEYIDKEVNKVDALNFVDAYFTPHIQISGKLDRVRNSLKYLNKVGISLSNCCAIEIIDEQYKIIKSKPADESFDPYALKTYWDKNEMFESEIDNTDEYKSLNELLSQNRKKGENKMNLFLREINKSDKKEIEEMAEEFLNANDEYPFEGVSDLKKVLEKSFEEYYNNLEVNKHIDEIYPNFANQTTYVLADETGHLYGLANLRHELKGKLFEIGGHVGYGIRPSERKKGYATIQLGLLLEKIDELGIEQALITCRENNIGSKKTMEKYIGYSDSLVPSMHEGIMEYRYWIDVKENLKKFKNIKSL